MNKVISILIMLLVAIESEGIESYTFTPVEASTAVAGEADESLVQDDQQSRSKRKKRSRRKSSKTEDSNTNAEDSPKAANSPKAKAPEPVVHYVDLETLTADYVAKDGDVISGELDNHRLTIADKATVTLNGVSIKKIPNRVLYSYAGITCAGDATIILAPGSANKVMGGYENCPGIFVAKGKTLTIKGKGSLECSSQGWAAGIGGGKDLACGNIVIEGGSIVAKAGRGSAAIGSGWFGSCGNITIKSTVTSVTLVKKSSGGFSTIGAGREATCGTVTIADGAKVTEQ